MDPAQKQTLQIDDFFQQSLLANRLFLTPHELPDHLSQKEPIEFNIEDSVDHFITNERMPLPQPLHFDECHSVRNEFEADDTNQFEAQSGQKQKIDEFQELDIICSGKQEERAIEPSIANIIPEEEPAKMQQLQEVISYLVQYPNQPIQEIRAVFRRKLRPLAQNGVVLELVQKFKKLKKTKEELVKYCMRKAFKFILELPKNKHLLQVDSHQKFSFSKCKNRFLKNISDEKSMNSKFLQQIFGQKDFSGDYQLFLGNFDSMIEEDNHKKVNYLADLLSTQKQGKNRTVQMVRRLPWTKSILQRVKKISRQLTKYSKQ